MHYRLTFGIFFSIQELHDMLYDIALLVEEQVIIIATNSSHG